MIALLLYRTLAASLLPWCLYFVTGVVARSLNMPEPLVNSAGGFVLARVMAYERSIGRRLCSLRLARLLRSVFRTLR